MHPFELFFAEKYAAAYQAEREAEAARRSEAFLEIGHPVAGLSLRALTARDLYLLDGYESPFVCGDPAEAKPNHISAVLWMLRLDRVTGGGLREWWAYTRHERYLLRRWADPAVLIRDHATLSLWFADAFADFGAGRSQENAPPVRIGVHFLAGLLVPLCSEIGAIDPASGKPLIESPIARLYQYAKVIRAREEGKNFVDFNASDSLRGRALAEWNALSAEEKAPWLARCQPPAPAPASAPVNPQPAA